MKVIFKWCIDDGLRTEDNVNNTVNLQVKSFLDNLEFTYKFFRI